MLIALVSAKGSPGVTTTALTLAAAHAHTHGSDRTLLLEADGSGGDLECWCGPLGEPGLLGAVTDLREGTAAGRLSSFTVEAVPGVDAIAAPTTDVAAGAALRSAPTGFAQAVAATERTVIADLGRVASTDVRNDRVVAGAAAVILVCRPTLASVEHSRPLVAALSEITDVSVVVVGGPRPYGPTEIAGALGAPVAGVLPSDPSGVAALVERGISRAWLRSSLATAANGLMERFGRLTSADVREQVHG